MSQLASLIDSHAQELLDRWRRQVDAGQRSEAELHDQVPTVLQELARALRQNAAPEASGPRYRPGFSLEALAREYGLLRGLILNLVQERAAAVDFNELRVLSDFFATAVAESVAAYSRQREDAERDLQARAREQEASLGWKQAEAVVEAARAEAEHEREKLHSLFMQAPVGICMLEGPKHVFTFANPRYRALVNGRDIVGKPLLEALPDLENEGFDELMDRVVATGEPFAGQGVVVKLDHHVGDERLVVDFVYQPKRNAQGEIDGILAIVIDVTEQWKARRKSEALAAALARNEEYLRLVIESSGAATFSLDLATGVMSVDARYRELAGLTADEPVTRERRLEIIHPEDSPRVAEKLREAASGTTGRYQAEYRTTALPDGGHRWVQSTGKVKDGTIFGINVDITPQKRAEEERARLLEEAKQRSAFDQQILGIVSHDLRNPLTAIVFSAATLSRRESLDEKSRKSAERIQSAAQRASRMVNDLLDFTQARLGGGIPVTRKQADLAEITRAVLAEMEAAHPARELRLQVSGGVLGVWDPDRLAQVVQNLVGNALTYSPADSEVVVEIRGVGQEARLSVHNSGEAISPELMSRLFEPMQRGSAATGQTRSVGLGLYIVKAVVEAHGGSVEVQSDSAAGTTFTVRLPRS